MNASSSTVQVNVWPELAPCTKQLPGFTVALPELRGNQTRLLKVSSHCNEKDFEGESKAAALVCSSK